VIINAVYIPLAEEPSLAKQFGDDYLTYKQNVPRWAPRLTLWPAEPSGHGTKTMKFPEPLFECCFMTKPKLCLACGEKEARSVLRNTERDVCPLCDDCSTDWNFYGYSVLKRIKPLRLMRNICVFKLMHPWQPSFWTIWGDIQSFKLWGEHMRKFKHLI
jgi:hypothetical protein